MHDYVIVEHVSDHLKDAMKKLTVKSTFYKRGRGYYVDGGGGLLC